MSETADRRVRTPRAARAPPGEDSLGRHPVLEVVTGDVAGAGGAGGEEAVVADAGADEADAAVAQGDVDAAGVRRGRPAHADADPPAPGPRAGVGGAERRRRLDQRLE